MKDYREIINQLYSENWDESLEASDRLVKIYESNNQIVDLLIEVLENAESDNAINATALALREISDNKAFDALLKAIEKRKSSNNISTLVYALENYNCKNHFLDIFSLFVFSNKADVMLSSYNILTEQVFEVSREDLNIAQKILNNSGLSYEDKDIAHNILKRLSYL